MEPTVREVEDGDLPAIADIYGYYVLHSVATFEQTPPGLDYWRTRRDDIAARGLPFLVAVTDDRVVGYALASPWRPRPAYRWTVEDSVYVAPGLARRGIGSMLLAELIARLRALRLREVIAVIADAGDGASPGLHARLGFEDAGRLLRVGYKFDRWIDTMIMQLSLEPDEAAGS